MSTITAPSASRHHPRTIAPVGFIRALIVLHAVFRRRRARDRSHILIRFLTSPMLRVLNALPPGASLLDIGAGHGLFAALARNGRRVVAVEPDARKVHAIEGVEFVIGFDDVPIARHTAPPLSTVRQPLDAMARASADLLVERLAGERPPAGLVLPTTLVIRDST